ncbi:type I restriction-modification system subunit M [Canicola haemoglobinophilus]|uniref:class I SAM-dependent DNA methyltransferase n=1 Tax=Canicola haemoglobinophilus TaxID=733 RepID=UPI000E1C06C6|nr:type I restriction-modification system subunit M [Canicola haemoglobinophilus]
MLAAQQAFLNDLDTKLWQSADRLRQQLDAANYKHIVLGLIFLKYASDAFEAQREKVTRELQDPNSPFYLDPTGYSPEEFEQLLQSELEVPELYIKDHVLIVPEKARWNVLNKVVSYQNGQELPWGEKFNSVTKLIDNAFIEIERHNQQLKGAMPIFATYDVTEDTLIGLFNTFSDTNFSKPHLNGVPLELSSKDILGHVYEYFLGEFAREEGKRGGEFFTPKSIVSLIVEMLQPYKGRIYDPAMGAGGFFVQAEKFINAHQGKIDDVSIYGQEFNSTTWKLAAMNMAIRGIGFNFGERANTFTNPQHPDLRADFIMANPPFNISEWWEESLNDDPRWQYGIPPKGNANFGWLQHMIYHLSPTGKIAMVMANGSMSSQTNNEGEIRKNIINADLVEAMIALPAQLFANVQIPACIWILNKRKTRKGEVLFIDARQIGYMKTRTQKDFTNEDIAKIADTYHQWQLAKNYQNQPAYCYAATLAEIAENDFVLTPGRYVGTAEQEDDGIPFAEKMQELTALLQQQFAQSAELEAKIKENLKGLGYE